MVVFKERFESDFKAIFDFIAQDSLTKARNFKDELLNRIEALQNFPYKYRKSTKFDDENIRDLIFKGYVIPYLIDKGVILILGIYKENLWEEL